MRDEHPENDLHSGTDRYNLPRPQPRSFDEMADEPDPLVLAQRNRASTKQAIWYAVIAVATTILFGVGLATVSRVMGGPLCAEGDANWLCTESWRFWWAILCSIPPVVFLLGCAVIMVRKLNRYERWVPWMGVFWLPLVPFTIWWLTYTVGILALDYAG